MNAYEREQLIMNENQKVIQARMDAQRQHREDMIQGTKDLAEEREARLQELADKRNQHKEETPLTEAEELQNLREKAKLADAQEELQALRKRFAKDGE